MNVKLYDKIYLLVCREVKTIEEKFTNSEKAVSYIL